MIIHRRYITRLVKFNPSHNTLIAYTAVAGIIMLSLALLLVPAKSFVAPCHVILRDIIMVFLLGFCFPLYYINLSERHGQRCLGVTRAKLGLSLKINVALTIFVFAFFLIISPGRPQFNVSMLLTLLYLMPTGIFETVFFFGFLRHFTEKAFGVVPAIILTAICYSLHHVGFQPEFIKFFLLGIILTSIFYVTRNIFILFPFFWSVGAFWDTQLMIFESGMTISLAAIIVAVCQLIAMAVYAGYIYHKKHSRALINTFLSIKPRSIQIPSKTRHFHNM